MRSINKIQILIGILGLLFGTVVYLADRPPTETYFLNNLPVDVSLFNTVPNLFGVIGNNLPSFIHAFSFILITAGLTIDQTQNALLICLSWLLVDSAFELGQHVITETSAVIPSWFSGVPVLENTGNYFTQGTFDLNDLIAVALGAMIAYLVLLLTAKRRARS